MGQISFSYYDSNLDVTVEAGGFKGHTTVTDVFSVSFPGGEFRLFLEGLRAFPLRRSSFSLATSGSIEIEVDQVDALGHLELRAKLDHHISRNSVKIFLPLDYEVVARLERDLRKLLLDNKSGSFTLVTEGE